MSVSITQLYNNEHAAPYQGDSVSGDFITREGERFYAIRNIDQLPVFFISLVSHSDHWLFIASNGGMTAGRVSPEIALFPYAPVDKVQDSALHTGSKTIIRVVSASEILDWEPFNYAQNGRFQVQRYLYKNVSGNKLCFEEINHDLQLVFRYTWATSDEYGFVRECELVNVSDDNVDIDLIDGLQNILPAQVPRSVQTDVSNLVDAYKWNELDESTGLAFYTLYSGITDKPEPYESLRANTVFCQGLDNPEILLSSEQLVAFRKQPVFQQKNCVRGMRGAYLVSATLTLEPQSRKNWRLVANVDQTQAQVAELRQFLMKHDDVEKHIEASVAAGEDELKRIIAGMDGLQVTAEENVSVHHYANVLFNGMRGGVFNDQYDVDANDFCAMVRHFNHKVFDTHEAFLSSLPDRQKISDLRMSVRQQNDAQLERLCYEYLPLTFGRRHGDPSRPWNHFEIRLKDKKGQPLLSYQGNWRDIFQNWEALLLGYPAFIEHTIAKFVNASTIDGFNPYRITRDGIDWEIEDPEDPWSYIGYWGDHQIIYLLKLLELLKRYAPEKSGALLRQALFCYANVPYRIKPFNELLDNPKDTVEYDHDLARLIDQRVAEMGADGKLLIDASGDVYHVNLMEKLLVPLLAKLGNLVPQGGIWLNTQRPEWNDANNALVGYGLSMVTLYYMRRYVSFMQALLAEEKDAFVLSTEVGQWLNKTASVFDAFKSSISEGRFDVKQRYAMFEQLGKAASEYRQAVYQTHGFSGTESYDVLSIKLFLEDAEYIIEQSIKANQRPDGLYHAYNLLDVDQGKLKVDKLYLMLEGQVAVLSSGMISPDKAADMLEALFQTDLYRAGQNSFMLYPDRSLPGFLEKNIISEQQLKTIPGLMKLLETGDKTLLVRDVEQNYRFNADIISRAVLKERLDTLSHVHGEEVSSIREPILTLYEATFSHKVFTGRSGGMFAFEGLGSIYWHMVSKLLLASQEIFFQAIDQNVDEDLTNRLAALYYRIREGIGFNKTPEEYGAFPTDPYSHTPLHAGAQQPGMTGQVKEEVLTRFGELGVRVDQGRIRFEPALLREREFVNRKTRFQYLDVNEQWQEVSVPDNGLAFTWCQVPIVYRLDDDADTGMEIQWSDQPVQIQEGFELSVDISHEIFQRSGKVQKLTLTLNSHVLYIIE